VAERKRETDWRAEAEDDSASDDGASSSSSEPDGNEVEGERGAGSAAPQDLHDGRAQKRSASGSQQRTRQQGERTEVIPRGSLRASESERSQTSTRGSSGAARRGRPGVRRVKRVLRHVDPLSIFKLSLFYYMCFVVLWLVFVAVVYAILSSTGLLDRAERLGRLFVLWEEIDISLWFVERWALLIGLVFAVLASVVNVLLAFLYNVAADVMGGAELTFVDREL
jgi:Transmembrane domain of unknown function (DUF3566)